MRVLLDTRTLIWAVDDPTRLTQAAVVTLQDPTNELLVSAATVWEVAIKVSRKKLDLGAPYRGYIHMHMLRNNFELLPITDEHMAGLIDMPFHHKDPFDRMLIAQAGYENIPIVSADAQFDAYGITRIW